MIEIKKIINLWIRTTNVYLRIFPSLVFCMVLIGIDLIVNPAYIKFIKQIPVGNTRVVFAIAGVVVFMCLILSLRNIFYNSALREFQFQYWLGLEKKEFYFFILLDKIGWYYLYFGIMLSVTVYSLKTIIFWGIIYSVLYIIFTYQMYQKACIYLHKGKKQRRKMLKKERGLVLPRGFGKFHPNIELIVFGVLYRYRSIEGLICKVAIISFAIILPSKSIEGVFGLVLYLILSTVLTLSNEGYWTYEIENIFVFQMTGSPFHKFFLINLISDILFNTLPLSLVLAIVCKNGELILAFSFLSCCIIGYCNLLYLFVMRFIDKRNDMLRTIGIVLGLFIGFFPIMNILFGMYLYKKVSRNWEVVIC